MYIRLSLSRDLVDFRWKLGGLWMEILVDFNSGAKYSPFITAPAKFSYIWDIFTHTCTFM